VAVDEPTGSAVRRGFEQGELAGYIVVGGFLLTLTAAMICAGAGTIDDVAVWILGGEFAETLLIWGAGLAVLVAVVWFRRWSSDATAYRIGTVGHHADGQTEAAIHEGYGHAAVAHGVGVRVRSAEANRNGGGVTRLDGGDYHRASAAEKLAISRSGEVAAGPEGCGSDRRTYASILRQVPRRERSAVEAEAARLCARHVGNSFGQRVARALAQNGRWH
jgi:hypothetical protein